MCRPIKVIPVFYHEDRYRCAWSVPYVCVCDGSYPDIWPTLRWRRTVTTWLNHDNNRFISSWYYFIWMLLNKQTTTNHCLFECNRKRECVCVRGIAIKLIQVWFRKKSIRQTVYDLTELCYVHYDNNDLFHGTTTAWSIVVVGHGPPIQQQLPPSLRGMSHHQCSYHHVVTCQRKLEIPIERRSQTMVTISSLTGDVKYQLAVAAVVIDSRSRHRIVIIILLIIIILMVRTTTQTTARV